MEPRQPGSQERPEPQAGGETETTQANIVRRLLRRLGEPFHFGRERTPADYADEEEELEDKPESTKRNWQRFRGGWRNLFGRVTKPPIFVGRGRRGQPAEAERSSKPATIEIPPATTAKPEEPEIAAAVAQTEQQPGQATAQTEADQPAAEAVPPPHRQEAAPTLAAQMAAAEQLMAPFMRSESTPPPTHTVERVVENRRGAGAVGALLGLEYIGRRRAVRKERRERQKQDRVLEKKLEQQQEVTKQQARHMEGRVQTAQEELKIVREQEKAFEAKIARAEQKKAEQRQAAQREAIIAESEEVKRYAAAQAKTEQTAELKQAEQLPIVEELMKSTEKLKRPETVLERATVAAEQNIPLEAIYERRHEVKDQLYKDSLSPAAVAAGGGGGMAAETDFRAALDDHIKSVKQQSGRLAVPEKLYKNAMMSGVWGAFIVLAFIAVIFLLSGS